MKLHRIRGADGKLRLYMEEGEVRVEDQILSVDEFSERAADIISGEVRREARRMTFNFGSYGHGYAAAAAYEATIAEKEGKRLHI